MSDRQTQINNTKGIREAAIFATGISANLQSAKRFTPNGGVIMPRARLTTMMVPKCTGSTPNWMPMGTRIGASTMMAADVSINIPIINKATLTPSRNSNGDRSEAPTSELQSPMRTSYAVICLKTKSARKPNNKNLQYEL